MITQSRILEIQSNKGSHDLAGQLRASRIYFARGEWETEVSLKKNENNSNINNIKFERKILSILPMGLEPTLRISETGF